MNRPNVPASEPQGPSFTPRTLLLFGAAGVLVVVAVLEKNPVPLFASLVFLLAPVAAGLDSPRPPLRAALTWETEGGGATVDIRGTVQLPSSVSPTAVHLELRPVPPLTERQRADARPAGTALEFRAFWRAPFPCMVRVPIPTATWQDPLDLVEIPVELKGTDLPIERFPPEALQLSRVRLRRTTLVPGEIRSRLIGEAGEFFAVRPAFPTDPLRRINWTATARAGRRMANEFNLERTGDIVLLIDTRPTPLGPELDSTLVSLECVAALGIASGFLREKGRVGLGVFDEFLRAIPLGSGRIHRARIAEMLRTTTVGATSGPSERFAISVRRYFPSGVSTLVLSPLAFEESETLLTHLRRRGFAPLALSPSPLPLTEDRSDRTRPVDPLARRLALLLRRAHLTELWAQAPVIDWDNYWSLASLIRYLRAPPRARGVA